MRTVRAGGYSIAGRERMGLGARGLVCAALSCVALCFSAHAQDLERATREVPIGAFTVGTPHDGMSIVEPPEGLPKQRRDGAADDSGSWPFQSWQQPAPSRDVSPDALYDQAIIALDGGRRTDAQRLFERLIADAPDSARATDARQHLGAIYRGAKIDEAAVVRPAAAVPDSALGAVGAPSRAELHQARVMPSLDSQFLSEAGDRVFFSAGSTNLGIRAQGVIQSQARFLQRYPELSAAIEGFADDGSIPDDETRRLAEARAVVVRERLIAEGVDAMRLLAYGRGREDRVSDCPQPECLAQNRRVVTILLSSRLDAMSGRRVQSGSSPVQPTQ